MNYIEQMMKMSGVEQEEEKYCYWECKNPELRNIACNNTQCTHYRHVIHPYPPFTAEKQLELIKLISDFRLYAMEDGTYDIRGRYIEVTDTKGNFSQALAQLTTELMNAGELDKEKVKEVLEDAR